MKWVSPFPNPLAGTLSPLAGVGRIQAKEIRAKTDKRLVEICRIFAGKGGPNPVKILRRREPFRTRVLQRLGPWSVRILKRSEPWTTRLQPHYEHGKVWVIRCLDYIAPDWNHELREKNNRLMVEKLYHDLGGANFVAVPVNGGEPAGIGIISPVNAGFAILNGMILNLSPFEWNRESVSLDMNKLANLPEKFGRSKFIP